MIKAVILDFDGTLVDSVGYIWDEYRRVMELMSLPKVSFSEFTRHMGKPWTQVLTSMWPGLDVAEFNRHYNVAAERAALVDGGREALSKLKGEYKLAILTSRGEKTLRMHMEKAGIDQGIFSVIMHKDNSKSHKPDPGAILETCRTLGVGKDEALYVGDSVVDAQCAKNAGVMFVGVLSGGAKKRDFEEIGASCVLSSLSELPAFLKKTRVRN